MKQLLIFIFLSAAFMSCQGRKGVKEVSNKDTMGVNIIKEARYFSVVERDGYRILEVINPWDTTKLLHRYILVNKEDSLPSDLPDGVVVRTPVERIIAYTAVDIGSLEALKAIESVVGVCESRYILSPYIHQRLNLKQVKDLGSYTKPNIEQLLSSNADLIITSPYNGRDYGLIEKLNIPIAECASYMEKTPLGRCEWIKFYAQFLNKQTFADSLYHDISDKYLTTKSLIEKRTKIRPTILADKRYGQVWFASPGNSYAARLYSDAGANYFWGDTITSGAIPLSFETVFKTAHNADVWIFTYCKPDGFITLNELKSEYSSYAEFSAFKNKRIFGCNSEKVPLYEESPLRPDLLLLDMAKMLHPELFEEHNFVYYKNLE